LLLGGIFAATQRPTKVALDCAFKIYFEADSRHFVVMHFEGENTHNAAKLHFHAQAATLHLANLHFTHK